MKPNTIRRKTITIIKGGQERTRRETAMGGLLVLLMKSLLRTTLLKGALERRAKNLYN